MILFQSNPPINACKSKANWRIIDKSNSFHPLNLLIISCTSISVVQLPPSCLLGHLIDAHKTCFPPFHASLIYVNHFNERGFRKIVTHTDEHHCKDKHKGYIYWYSCLNEKFFEAIQKMTNKKKNNSWRGNYKDNAEKTSAQ